MADNAGIKGKVREMTSKDGQITMALGGIDRIMALTNLLHGDGLFPIYKDNLAMVSAGTGLQVKVKDYMGLIDGTVVFNAKKKNVNWARFTNITVQAIGISYLIIKPLYSAQGILAPDEEEQSWISTKGGVPQIGEGVFQLVTELPADGYILIAKLTIPIETTQVTDGMIDNTVKKYLLNIDDLAKANRDMITYIDERIAAAKTDLFKQLSVIMSAQVITEMATLFGLDAETIASKKLALDNIIVEYLAGTATYSEVEGTMNDLIYYVFYSIAWDAAMSDELKTVVDKFSEIYGNSPIWRQDVNNNISNIYGNIDTIFSVIGGGENPAPPELSNVFVAGTLIEGEAFSAAYSYYDPNGDPEGLKEIRWYKNGELVPELNDVVVVPGLYADAEDEWYFTIKISDGDNWSALITSGIVTIFLTTGEGILYDNFEDGVLTDKWQVSLGNMIEANGYLEGHDGSGNEVHSLVQIPADNLRMRVKFKTIDANAMFYAEFRMSGDMSDNIYSGLLKGYFVYVYQQQFGIIKCDETGFVTLNSVNVEASEMNFGQVQEMTITHDAVTGQIKCIMYGHELTVIDTLTGANTGYTGLFCMADASGWSRTEFHEILVETL